MSQQMTVFTRTDDEETEEDKGVLSYKEVEDLCKGQNTWEDEKQIVHMQAALKAAETGQLSEKRTAGTGRPEGGRVPREAVGAAGAGGCREPSNSGGLCGRGTEGGTHDHERGIGSAV